MIDNTLTLLGGENSRKLLTAIEEAIFNDLVANDETPERLSSQDDFSRITGLLETLVELQTSAIEKDVTLERIATIPQVIQTNDQNILNSNIIKLGLTAPFNNLIDVIKNLDVSSEGDFERTKKFLETVDISNHTAQHLLKILKLTENDLATSDSTSQIVKNKIVQFEKLYKISKTRADAQIESLSQLKTLIANVTQSDLPDYTSLNQLVNLLEQFDLPQNLMAIKTSIQKIIESEIETNSIHTGLNTDKVSMVNKPDVGVFKTIETNPIHVETRSNKISTENVSTATKTIASESDRILKTIAKTSTNNELSESKSDLKTSESDSIETNSIPTATVSTSVPDRSQLTSYQNGIEPHSDKGSTQSETLIKRFITTSADLVRSLVKSSRSHSDGIKNITETNSSPVETRSDKVSIESERILKTIETNVLTDTALRESDRMLKTLETNVLSESENDFKTIANVSNDSERILKTIETNSIPVETRSDKVSIETHSDKVSNDSDSEQDSIDFHSDKKSIGLNTDKVSTSQSETLITQFITTSTDFIRSLVKSSRHIDSGNIKTTNEINSSPTDNVSNEVVQHSTSGFKNDSKILKESSTTNNTEATQNLKPDTQKVLAETISRIENPSFETNSVGLMPDRASFENPTVESTTTNQNFKDTSTSDNVDFRDTSTSTLKATTGIIQRFITTATGFIQTVTSRDSTTNESALRDSTSTEVIPRLAFETRSAKVSKERDSLDTLTLETRSDKVSSNNTDTSESDIQEQENHSTSATNTHDKSLTETKVLKAVTSTTEFLGSAIQRLTSVIRDFKPSNNTSDTSPLENNSTTNNKVQQLNELTTNQNDSLSVMESNASQLTENQNGSPLHSNELRTNQVQNTSEPQPEARIALQTELNKISEWVTETFSTTPTIVSGIQEPLFEDVMKIESQTTETIKDLQYWYAQQKKLLEERHVEAQIQNEFRQTTSESFLDMLGVSAIPALETASQKLLTSVQEKSEEKTEAKYIEQLEILESTFTNELKKLVDSGKITNDQLKTLSRDTKNNLDVLGQISDNTIGLDTLNQTIDNMTKTQVEKSQKVHSQSLTKLSKQSGFLRSAMDVVGLDEIPVLNKMMNVAINRREEKKRFKLEAELKTKQNAIFDVASNLKKDPTHLKGAVEKATKGAVSPIMKQRAMETTTASYINKHVNKALGIAAPKIKPPKPVKPPKHLPPIIPPAPSPTSGFGLLDTIMGVAGTAIGLNQAGGVIDKTKAFFGSTPASAANLATEANTAAKVSNVSNLATEANTAAKVATVASEAGTIAEVGAGSKAMGFAKGLGGVASKLAAPLTVAATLYNNADEIAEKGSIQASTVFNKLGTNLEDTFSLSDSLFSFKRFGGALGVLGNVTADIPMMVGTKVGELARGATNAIIGDKTTTSMADSFFGFFTGKSNNEATAQKEQEAAITKFKADKEIADKKKAAELESEKKREALLKAESDALKAESETLNPKAADLVETPSTGLNTTTQLENKSIEPQSNKGSIETSNVSNTADIVNQKSDSNLTKSNSIDYQSDKKSNDFTSDKNSIDTSQKTEFTGVATRYTPVKLGEYTGTDNEIAAQKEQALSIERFNKFHSDKKTEADRDLKSRTAKEQLLNEESEILRASINNDLKTVETGLTSYQNGNELNADKNARALDSIQGFTRTSIDNNSDKKSIETNSIHTGLNTDKVSMDKLTIAASQNLNPDAIQGFTRTSINSNEGAGIAQNHKTGEIQRFTTPAINTNNSNHEIAGISQNHKTGEIKYTSDKKSFESNSIGLNADTVANDLISLKTGEPIDKNSTGFTRFNKLNQSNSQFNDLGESHLTSYQNDPNDNPYMNAVSLQDSDRLAGQTLNTTKLLNDTLQQMSMDVSPNVTQPPPVVINAPTTSRSSGGEKISGVQAPMYTHNDDSTLRTIVNQMFAKTFV